MSAKAKISLPERPEIYTTRVRFDGWGGPEREAWARRLIWQLDYELRTMPALRCAGLRSVLLGRWNDMTVHWWRLPTLEAFNYAQAYFDGNGPSIDRDLRFHHCDDEWFAEGELLTRALESAA